MPDPGDSNRGLTMRLGRIVIAGAGLAGLRAAEALRAAGYTAALDIVGAERHLPYTRPPLSKSFLAAGGARVDYAFPGALSLDASWHLGSYATRLDLNARALELDNGKRLPFDGLVLATGSRARDWLAEPPPNGVLTLRTIDDAQVLRAAVRGHRRRILIVGAGFIGGEVAAQAALLGHRVTVVEIEDQPLVRLLGVDVGKLLADSHRGHGVDLRLGTAVERFAADGAALRGAWLSDGTYVAADLCVLALGAEPSTSWLSDSGIQVNGGVVCTADLRVCDVADVVAAGDVARWPHPMFGGESVNIGHWTNAAEQGAHAARTLLASAGDSEPFTDIPTFWSELHDLKLRSVGLPGLATEIRMLEGDLAESKGVVGYFRSGQLVGVLGINCAVRQYRDLVGAR